jgi:hypothetical protein
MTGLLAVECGTFTGLGAWFLVAGQWRLGIPQLLLAGVQWTVYSGRMA